MSVKDDSETKQSVYGDTTPRVMRQLKCENDNLYKEFTKLQEKHAKTKENLSKLQVSYSNLEKELSLTKTNQKKIMTQKLTVEKELQEIKEYSRKLEQKIIANGKGPSLVEVNMQLSQKVQKLEQEKLQSLNKVVQLEKETQSLTTKTKVLTQICEAKAEEFGLSGEKRGEVLMNLISSNEAITKLKEVSVQLKEKLDEANYKVEELQIVRESNNEELNRLEEETFKLKNEVSQLVKANKDLAIDRNALLQCLEEMSSQQKQYEMDIENFSKQIELTSFEFTEKINKLQKEIDFKDEIIKKRSKTDSDELQSLKKKTELLKPLESENADLKLKLIKLKAESDESKKEFESREKKLKQKLASCFKEFSLILKEKEDLQATLTQHPGKPFQPPSKPSNAFPEDRPRQIDDTLLLLNQAKQKNLDLLSQFSKT